MSDGHRAVPGHKRMPDPSKVRHKKKYRNCGRRVVHGLKPGDAGFLELTDGEALCLIKAGHLVLAVGKD